MAASRSTRGARSSSNECLSTLVPQGILEEAEADTATACYILSYDNADDTH